SQPRRRRRPRSHESGPGSPPRGPGPAVSDARRTSAWAPHSVLHRRIAVLQSAQPVISWAPVGDKVRSLKSALDVVSDGSHVALGGFAITRCVMPAVHGLVRSHRRRLTVSQTIGGLDTDVLVAGGCVSRLIYAGGSLDRFGPLYAVSHAMSHHEIDTEEYSSLAMTLRFHAGAMNLPFIPC